MNSKDLESNILKVSNELNELFLIQSSTYGSIFSVLMVSFAVLLFISIMGIYQEFHYKSLKKYSILESSYLKKYNRLEKLYPILGGSIFIIICSFGLFFLFFLFTFDKYDEGIEIYVKDNKEVLIEMFAEKNTYEVTDIMTGNTYNNNYFITYRNDKKLGQLLTKPGTKIKKSNENKITFYETRETIKKINELQNKGVKLNSELLNLVKEDLPYYEIEAKSIK